MKALAIGVILLLAYTSAVAYSQSSGYVITVQTDKLYYYVGDRVYISGSLTYSGYPSAQNVFINIYVAPANYNLYAWTDSNGNYNANFTLGTNLQLGNYTVSVTALTAPTCANQTTFQLITAPFSVPVTPLGTLAAIVAMISVLGVYITLRKRKL